MRSFRTSGPTSKVSLDASLKSISFSSSPPTGAGKPRFDVARRSSLEDGITKHFEEEKMAVKRKTPQLVFAVSVAMLAVLGGLALVFVALRLWISVFYSVVSSVTYFVILGLLRRNLVFAAKSVFVVNWFIGVTIFALTLSSKAATGSCYLMAAIWVVTFDELHLGNRLGSLSVIGVSSLFLLFIQFVAPNIHYMRESFSHVDLVTINKYLDPLFDTLTLILLCLLILHLKELSNSRELRLQSERNLVDKIVCGLLPSKIVERMKKGEAIIADLRPLACVLFLDIINFTSLASNLKPSQLVQGLMGVFSEVESVVKQFPLVEKIKSIGDALLLSSGTMSGELDVENVAEVMRLALALRERKFIMQYVDEDGVEQAIPIEFRFGLHCGEVIAGIVSRERFAFDVLGDTVNTAARDGEPLASRRVLVTEEAKRRVEGLGFVFIDNGRINVKGKGAMDTYFLEGFRA